MIRWTTLLPGAAVCVLMAQFVRADFLVGHQGFSFGYQGYAQIVHNDGSAALQLTGGPSVSHETYDVFTLSADSQRIYIFANDLGYITVESWNAVTGAYAGSVGAPYIQWPNNFKPNYAIGEVHTRATFPSFGGDLLYVGPIGFVNGTFDPTKPIVNVVNTTTHQFVEQIVPPASITSIYDFTLGPGTLGPKSRAYINTEDGMFAFNETATTGFIGIDPITHQPIFDNSHFLLASATPLLTNLSSSASFDIGPTDGYLYVLDGAGGASSIKRYNTTTGALIDTFLTFAQYNYAGVVADNFKFGPDGSLYLSSSVPAPFNSRSVISRFDPTTGLRTNDYDLGIRLIGDFYPLAIPEPSTLGLLIFGVLLLWQRTRHS